jgi:hypothetical protein
LTALGVGWAVIMPVLMRLATRLNGWRQPSDSGRLLSATD